MEHRVFIPEKLDELYSYKANHPFFWNVHSDMNEGYRATDAMWAWVRQNGIEGKIGVWKIMSQKIFSKVVGLCLCSNIFLMLFCSS